MAQELEGTGGGERTRARRGHQHQPHCLMHRARAALIQPEVMQAPVVWLASTRRSVQWPATHRLCWDERLPLEERLAKASAPAAWPQLGATGYLRQGDDEWISSIGNGTRLMTAFCLPRKGTTCHVHWYALVIWLIAMAVWVAQALAQSNILLSI